MATVDVKGLNADRLLLFRAVFICRIWFYRKAAVSACTPVVTAALSWLYIGYCW